MNFRIVAACMAPTVGMPGGKPCKGAEEFTNHEAKSIKPLEI
jgi:hypothetical protein